ncbi:amidohydrolase [Bacillus canaveralius]|uniref:Amidohydrolase n=1 Tax=Bacillus canaveralius TaxID=1403243 RepID=A0A2N5GGB3_9BACI|nr:amidohydrolase family protein [Bacillus canaveralius]PLR79799.1 amidohydrolase [Bacillus canaveralius]PLR88298.1 amidohydrolase [Bacillus canaveralius]
MIIDTHHHIIPKTIVDSIRKGDSRFQAEIQVRDGQEWIVHRQGYAYPLFNKFYDANAKQEDMKAANLDLLVLSPAPPMFCYWLDTTVAIETSRMVNDGTAEFIAANRQLFTGMATVPLQEPELAVKELERVVDQLQFRAVEIGTSIEGTNLDDPKFLPFFEAAEALGVTLFLHPYYVGDKSGLSKYYFTNLIGNPLDTAVAASSLIFGGILDRFPDLKVMLAHGGGFFPYQIGRLDKGYEERKESRTCKEKPSSYLNRFYFDTLTFYPESLAFLVSLVGAKRVVLGSDYPFDMGTFHPAGIVEQCSLSSGVKESIYQHNAFDLFKMESTSERGVNNASSIYSGRGQ